MFGSKKISAALATASYAALLLSVAVVVFQAVGPVAA